MPTAPTYAALKNLGPSTQSYLTCLTYAALNGLHTVTAPTYPHTIFRNATDQPDPGLRTGAQNDRFLAMMAAVYLNVKP